MILRRIREPCYDNQRKNATSPNQKNIVKSLRGDGCPDLRLLIEPEKIRKS